MLDFLGRAGEDASVAAELKPPEAVREQSEALHSLLASLLVVDPTARPDAKEASRHAFLRDSLAEVPPPGGDSGGRPAEGAVAGADVVAPSKADKGLGGLLARVRLLSRHKSSSRKVHPENASVRGGSACVVQ